MPDALARRAKTRRPTAVIPSAKEGPLPDDPDAEDEETHPPGDAGGRGGAEGAEGPGGVRDDPLFVGVTNAAETRPGCVPEVPLKNDVFGVSRSLDAEGGMVSGETIKEDGE